MDGLIADSAEAEVERQVESERIAYLVRFYFEELRGRQREIFELADLQGKSTAEIAELLGIKPVTVRVTLLHARRAIRLRILEEHPEVLEDYAP
jgi:RNA polymerase sigma factor (sigma-70 family)